jgi:hypothetical protein
MSNILHKQKFTDNTNLKYINIMQNNNNINDMLYKSNLNSKSKSQIIMNNELHPDNFDLPITNIKNSSNISNNRNDIIENRRMANLNVSNSLRYGNNGRDFEMNYDNTFMTLNMNQINNYNMVIPVSRGGESTRMKKSELSNTHDEDNSERFIFKY